MLGAPRRTGSTCMGADPLGLEILLLDAGLLVTLYAMWRIVRASRAAVAAMLPGAPVAVGVYGTGIWVFLPPEQMRGMMMKHLRDVGGPHARPLRHPPHPHYRRRRT